MENELIDIGIINENQEIEAILTNNKIDFSKVYDKPFSIVEIKQKGEYHRLLTLSNFSAITGKSKAKKTYFGSLIMASIVANTEIQETFKATLPTGRKDILHFDTEQGDYDCYNTGNRINRLNNSMFDNYHFFCLREFDPLKRCEIIEYALDKFKDTLAFVLIDGIVDLSKAINDEAEATRVVSLLMKWTKKYNIHISVMIHENWNNDKATGHIGSFILKKAECVISVIKNENEKNTSVIKNTYMRGVMSFEDFEIIIEKDGLPYVNSPEYIAKKDQINQEKYHKPPLNNLDTNTEFEIQDPPY